jgi:AP-1 complex subunit sigma 1/2
MVMPSICSLRTVFSLLCRYDVVDHKIKKKTQREVTQLVLSRPSKMCNFIEWKDQKIIFKRLVFALDLCMHI